MLRDIIILGAGSRCIHDYTVGPLNIKALRRGSTKMLPAFRRTSNVMLPLLSFLFLQFARIQAKIVKPVELYAGIFMALSPFLYLLL